MGEVTLAITLDDATAAALFRAASEASTSASSMAAFLVQRGLNRRAAKALPTPGILVSYEPCGCLASADLTSPACPENADQFRREEKALGRTVIEIPRNAQVVAARCKAHDLGRSAA